jgi:hypothetical protein
MFEGNVAVKRAALSLQKFWKHYLRSDVTSWMGIYQRVTSDFKMVRTMKGNLKNSE